jgi:hypothetical protein
MNPTITFNTLGMQNFVNVLKTAFTKNEKQIVDRLDKGKPGVLVFHASETDSWFVTGKSQPELEYMMDILRRFIIPSYAVYDQDHAQFYLYSQDKDLHKAAKELFAGFYHFRSPKNNYDVIQSKIKQAIKLIDQSKSVPIINLTHHSYRHWFEEFRTALSLQDWEDAEKIISTISTLNLTSSDNLSFLRIELYARQGQWQKVYEHPEYALLAQISTPRSIQQAMLNAFHYTNLVPHEQQENWDECLEVLKNERSKLGILLSERSGLTQDAILRIFAYLAVIDDEPNAFKKVQNDATNSDFQTKYILSTLENRFTVISKPTETDEELSKKTFGLLSDGDLEMAWHYSEQIRDYIKRMIAQLKIARQSRDLQKREKIVNEYTKLPPENRDQLHSFFSDCERIIDEIGREFTDWQSWLDAVKNRKFDKERLEEELDMLLKFLEKNFWSSKNLSEMTDLFLNISNNEFETKGEYKYLREKLLQFILDNHEIPQQTEVVDFYQVLLMSITDGEKTQQRSLALLKLFDGILQNKPSELEECINTFHKWFMDPNQFLQPNAIETLDLLVYYGATSYRVYDWFSRWARELLNQPSNFSYTDLLVWRSFCEWLKIPDIEKEFDKYLEKQDIAVKNNPIVDFKENFQIAIFTFDVEAAKRAKKLLLEMNPKLDIRICEEKVNSKTVESLARNADMSVVVTTCLSHSIWYAIDSLVKNKVVLPKSRGAASIIDAIIQYKPVN